MSSRPQPPWHHDVRQHILLEYSHLKRQCPQGIYISLDPGNQTQWQGVLFVRTGPYSPAVLRFNILFPLEYPYLPPTIVFSSDIFHPLVTPLTTYTYTTGSTNSDTVSATDEERLPPGGFSLGHGFPRWFGRQPRSQFVSQGSSRKTSVSGRTSVSGSKGAAGGLMDTSSKSPTPRGNTRSSDEVPSTSEDIEGAEVPESGARPKISIVEVLRYLKRAFSEDSALDDVPLEAAGNSGAWKAWRAYRLGRMDHGSETGFGKKGLQGDEWNWDGVWEDRVRSGIDSSTAEAILFGSAANSADVIRFTDLDVDTVDEIRASVVAATQVSDR